MKKLLLTFAVIVLCTASFAQTITETTSSSKQTYVYCELVGVSNFLGTKVTVNIDFGQSKGFFEDTRLKDSKGELIKFNSMVDAMNFMGFAGWEFVQAYVVTTGNQSVYHWLLKNTGVATKDELKKSFDELKNKQ